MTKLCKDCRHHKRELIRETDTYERTYYADRCYFFEGQEHPVSGGKMEYIECGAMRMGPCGMAGNLFGIIEQ